MTSLFAYETINCKLKLVNATITADDIGVAEVHSIHRLQRQLWVHTLGCCYLVQYLCYLTAGMPFAEIPILSVVKVGLAWPGDHGCLNAHTSNLGNLGWTKFRHW